MKQKILHIPNFYPPHIGGIEDVCHSIVKNSPECEHRVLCFHDKQETQYDRYEGVEVVRCGVWKKLFSQAISFSYLGELRRMFKTFAPDIVHFHTPNPLGSVCLLLTLPRKTRLIVHHHSDIVAQKILSVFYSPIEQSLLSKADKIVATSPTYIPGSRPLKPWKEKIQVLPNTVDPSKLEIREGDEEKIQAIKDKYGNKKIVFAFGRNVPYKGFNYLLDAAEQLPEGAIIIIAGGGSFPPTKNCFFPGRLSDEELRCYLHASDVFAFPSITKNEAFGIALAEAMYCGLPAVTFTIPESGVNWVCLDGENGLEAVNRDTDSLAAAINRLLRDKPLRKTLGQQARERAKRLFTPEAVKKEIEKLYK